jgi:hypothetical protein
MPMAALNLALLFVFDFALLNLRTRDRDHSRCKALKPLEWRFCLLFWHGGKPYHEGRILSMVALCQHNDSNDYRGDDDYLDEFATAHALVPEVCAGKVL